MQALGQVMEGTSYLAQGKYNSAIAARNAKMQIDDGVAQEAQLRTDVRQTIGQQLVSQAGSGFQMGTGSHADALMESQVNGMMDALTLRRKAALAAESTIQQGKLSQMESSSRATSAYFGAAQSLANTAAKFAGS